MNENLDSIFSKAANSNLTATAQEFVPRSATYVHSRPGSANVFYGYHSNDNREQRIRTDKREECYDRRGSHYDRRNEYADVSNESNYDYEHQHVRLKQKEKEKNRSGYHGTYSHSRSNTHETNWPNQNKHNSVHYRRHDNDYDNLNINYTSRGTSERKPGTGTYNVRSSASEDGPHGTSEKKSWTRGLNSMRNDVDKRYGAATDDNSSCQRESLIEQLNKGIHECLICCEAIKQREPVWNCGNCYYVLHMWCVIKWARSSTAETNCWRCPACQYKYEKVPDKYMCFCGKSKLQTEWCRSDTAHSCGDVCGRTRENPTPWFVCEHRCTLLCHPGPCPPCTVQVRRECGCGRTQRNVQCSTKAKIVCGAICGRLLNCGIHQCAQTCHFGDCGTCKTKIPVGCYCGKKTVERTCGAHVSSKFSCEQTCGRTLSCGNHTCEAVCHEGECGLCPRDPIVVNTCACGKTSISENVRQSCTDEIPTCGQICGKIMKCGPPNRRHVCEKNCHEGECGPCQKQTKTKCRCGALEKILPCVKMDSDEANFRCEKKCSKKRSCGKHKCNQVCCVNIEHICAQRCNSSLNCGRHRCELLCHRGKCGRCLESSFEELYCQCGHSVIYPPVPCGTKPPECDQLCRRQHDCEHPPLHTCHSDQTCPPCTVFTEKLCYGGHESRKTVPCYQKEFSCGLPCGAQLPCGFHKCQVPCHVGDCLTLNKKCAQLCTKPRDLCGHPCAASCHSGNCPETSCKEMVTVTCACGNIVTQHPCYEHTEDYRRIVAATLAKNMSELEVDGGNVNMGDANDKITMVNLRTLECTDECKFILRNQRLALALQIQNPDLSAKLFPKYSDFMKSWAKKDPNLCRHVHDKLTALVKLAKESKQRSRSFSFEVMNKEKRQLVHEYCAHFGCESKAYDSEPKRNVVAIAVKGQCWLPSYSLLEMVQREMGQRKIPIPVINKKSTSRNDKGTTSVPTRIILPLLPNVGSSRPSINYFGTSSFS